MSTNTQKCDKILDLLWGNEKIGVKANGKKIMTHVLWNIPELGENIENLQDEFDDEGNLITLEQIWDKLLEKYDRMSMLFDQKK